MRLGVRLVGMMDETIPNRIEEIADEADPDQDVPDQFDPVKSFVNHMVRAFWDYDHVQTMSQSLDAEIANAITKVEERKRSDDVDDDWQYVSPAKVASGPNSRSTFSDIDE